MGNETDRNGIAGKSTVRKTSYEKLLYGISVRKDGIEFCGGVSEGGFYDFGIRTRR